MPGAAAACEALGKRRRLDSSPSRTRWIEPDRDETLVDGPSAKGGVPRAWVGGHARARATRPKAAAACEALRRRQRRLDSNPPLALALSRLRTTPPANRRRNDGGWRTRVETNACNEEGWRRAARSAREEVGRRRSGVSDHTMEHHLKVDQRMK